MTTKGKKFAGLPAAQERAAADIERPKGKRGDPDYLQTTVYLPRDLHHAVKVALTEDRGELSGLVETLLSEWLTSRKP